MELRAQVLSDLNQKGFRRGLKQREGAQSIYQL
jgi:hypothetical protein